MIIPCMLMTNMYEILTLTIETMFLRLLRGTSHVSATVLHLMIFRQWLLRRSKFFRTIHA